MVFWGQVPLTMGNEPPGRLSVGGLVERSYTGRCHRVKPVELARKVTIAALTAVVATEETPPAVASAAAPDGTMKVLPMGLCPSTTPAIRHSMTNPAGAE